MGYMGFGMNKGNQQQKPHTFFATAKDTIMAKRPQKVRKIEVNQLNIAEKIMIKSRVKTENAHQNLNMVKALAVSTVIGSGLFYVIQWAVMEVFFK
ncbi:hypothetical protein V6R21_12135 [Limibacter armeniacum]|uniref:hypothetical protein n=1 Tax=Limibacter armeniacum TaxID=466084 RepID=UPI002FE59F36